MSEKTYRLLEYHQQLDQKLRAEMKRRWPDIMQIARLKKLKLAVKDRLARLSNNKPTLQRL